MKYALIIGNNRYNDPKLAQLKTPAADSQALAAILADKNIGSFDEVTPLINRTETEARRAISSFLSNKKPDDLVLVYFSGHGVLDDRGRLFLSLKDTETSLLKATAIPSTFISDEMDSCRSRRQVLILDCCHSGAFARGTKGEQKAVTEATFEGSGYGRVVMTASDSTQYALEGDQVISQSKLSLFTHFLLEGLKTGEADMDQDGQISLDEWYDYTYARVISETPRQIPHRWSYNQQGDLVIARNPNIRKRVAELPPELLQAVESPFTSIRESALNELGKLLRSRDPETAELARLSLERMKEDDSRRISSAADRLLASFTPPGAAPVPPADLPPDPLTNAEVVSLLTLEAPPPQVEKSVPQVDAPRAAERPVFNRGFWLKWIGIAAAAGVLAVLVYSYNKSVDGEGTALPVVLFVSLAGLTSWVQRLVFGKQLGWWVTGNLTAGLALGLLHNHLYNVNGDWWSLHLGLLLIYWLIANSILGLVLLGYPQSENLSGLMQGGARRHVPLLLLAVALLLSSLSNIIIFANIYSLAQPVLTLYGISAILTGLSFILSRQVPRNIGFILLSIFLLWDGINCVLTVVNPDYPEYSFAVNAITALAAAAYFISHRETWKNYGFMLGCVYLLLTAVAGLNAYSTELMIDSLALATLFGLPAAILVFLGR